VKARRSAACSLLRHVRRSVTYASLRLFETRECTERSPPVNPRATLGSDAEHSSTPDTSGRYCQRGDRLQMDDTHGQSTASAYHRPAKPMNGPTRLLRASQTLLQPRRSPLRRASPHTPQLSRLHCRKQVSLVGTGYAARLSATLETLHNMMEILVRSNPTHGTTCAHCQHVVNLVFCHGKGHGGLAPVTP
jgi:hypothetical protein